MSAHLKPVRRQPTFLTVPELAEMLRKKPRTIYEMVAQERVPYRKVGGTLLFDLDEVIEWTKVIPQLQAASFRSHATNAARVN
ncbi:MAG: helix-turn-helix domain-containing protein [Pyrinomonadaceae bacterium]